MNDQSQIGFEQLGISAALKRYRLIVPPNQRDYAWEAEQVATLFEDLALAIQEDEQNYFLGTLVTVPVENGILEVVDGQQRLATTTLALAAMQHLTKQEFPMLARALEDFLISVDSQTLEPSPKMRLNTADTAVFHSLISDGTVGPGFVSARFSHENLRQAYDTAMTQWAKIAKPLNPQDRISTYKRWMNFIEFNAKVILLQVPNSVNAFKMFETLNDRGLKTSQADLVKNYVFGQSGKGLNAAQSSWSYIKGSLEAVGEDDITVNFLRQTLICQNGYMKESQVYEKVQGSVKGEVSAQRFLSELEYLSRDYAALFNWGAEKWTTYPAKARRSLEVIDLFDIKPYRPLLLAISRKFAPQETADAFEGLVALGVRLIIASSTRSGSVEQPLAKGGNQVYRGDITTAKDLFASLSNIIPTDAQFRQSFEIATVSNPKFARYYLRTLELAAAQTPEPWFMPNEDAHAITLEHVLPQRPEGNWTSFSDDEARIYYRRIGNLVLLQAKTNSDLRSNSFEDKKPELEKSPYITTKMVAEADDWNVERIKERQIALAEIALKAWKL